MAAEKPIHTVVLDAGPIIRGEPGISSLLQQCEQVVSTPEVIREIRDEATRSRLQTTLLPFLTLRSPNPESVKVITNFARKTGDLAVLSRVDIHLLALSYELECELNGGDWRLRSAPGQKRVNGPSPAKIASEAAAKEAAANPEQEATDPMEPEAETAITEGGPVRAVEPSTKSTAHDQPTDVVSEVREDIPAESESAPDSIPIESAIESEISDLPVTGIVVEEPTSNPAQDQEVSPSNEDASMPNHVTSSVEELSQKLADTPLSGNPASTSEDDSDGEGWITPSNLKKKQTEDTRQSNSSKNEPARMQVATITGDFAMQNVLLQMNLNLLSPTLNRIRNIKTFVLRCHACFNIVKDTTKQFCPRCGKPTLTRVSCTTDANGEFKLHLKKNMQWNSRGDRFSIPKPVAGASNGKVVGGGKNGWGNGLIFAEDQKEYVRGNEEGKRLKQRDLMDEDYLPGILTGDRRVGTGQMKVGAGRNVNSKKR